MRFRVPQFIEVEDKLFGPLTFKQFVYLAGGIGLVFVIYKLLPFTIAILLILPAIGLSVALAFYKPNGKPFVFMLQSFVKYISSSKLYIWKQNKKKASEKNEEEETALTSLIPVSSSSNLRDLSWSLDIQEGSSLEEE